MLQLGNGDIYCCCCSSSSPLQEKIFSCLASSSGTATAVYNYTLGQPPPPLNLASLSFFTFKTFTSKHFEI
jgi:hypothetical protein